MGDLLNGIKFKYMGLPYIFSIYKLHKKKYHWITSATNWTFSGLASMITQVMKLILYELKQNLVWGASKKHFQPTKKENHILLGDQISI